MRSSKPITVTLGKQQRVLDERLRSGAYESASEVMRAALRALEREDEAVDAVMREKIQEALDDPAEDIAAEDVFADMLAYHEAQMKAGDREP